MPVLSAKRQGWRLVALSLVMLLPSLGISVANIALPSLQASFGVSSQEAQWVVIAYLVVVTSFIVTAGRLGDLLGHKRLLLAGVAIFAAASFAAMFAPTLWFVVAARAVQGIGAAMMMSLAVAAVRDAVPEQQSGTAMGLLGTVSAVGTAAGPSLGGVLVSTFGWSSIFALMAGASLLAGLFVAATLPTDGARQHPTFDIPGAMLLMLSVGAVTAATTLSPLNYLNVVFAAVAAASIVVFLRVERRAAVPVVQLEMLQRPALTAGLLSIGLVSAIVMTALVVGPFYLTVVLRLDSAAAGLVMSVGPTVSAIVGIPAGRLVDRHGSVAAAYAGLALLLAGTLAMTLLPGAFGVAGYVGSLVLITSGYALFQAANNTSLMAATSKDQRGATSALLALARNLGLITGASAMASLFAFASGGGSPNNAGLQATFVAAAALALMALVLSIWSSRRPSVRRK